MPGLLRLPSAQLFLATQGWEEPVVYSLAED